MDIGYILTYVVCFIVIACGINFCKSDRSVSMMLMIKGMAYIYLALSVLYNVWTNGNAERYVTGLTLGIAIIEGVTAFKDGFKKTKNIIKSILKNKGGLTTLIFMEKNMEIRARPKRSYFYTQKTEKRKENSMETIISSCITAAVALVICLLNNHGQQEKTRALMEYKLDELTKRVDEHNHVVERTYSIERELSIQKEQIKIANHRIEDLEGIEHEH